MRKTIFKKAFPLAFFVLFNPLPLFAQEVQVERKEAPCNIGDGYQTINFGGGTSYSGYFRNCHPESGKAEYINNGQKITGYAEAIGNNKVRLTYDGGSITIGVVTRMIRR